MSQAADKVMRQAKPDDVFSFVPLDTIAENWSQPTRYLGDRRAFWEFFFDVWERQGGVRPRT